MSEHENHRLEKIIRRMNRIQRDIAADEQPVSPLQIEELERLGVEYADLLEVLRSTIERSEKFEKYPYK
jgi:hypothetical protein